MASSSGGGSNYLVISDLQIPFEVKGALDFCRYLQRHFKIPSKNILCAGDEVDQYFGGMWKKDPDAMHTPGSEIAESIDKIKKWADAFPHMLICESNHGQRWAKKAFEAEIPSIMMRKYQEVIGAPPGWRWARSWRIPTKHPFRVIHGLGYAGVMGHRTAAMDAGISTAIGHLHSSAGVNHIRTDELNIWGMNTGSLIDCKAYAFHYGKDSRFKPCVGAGVILDDGRMPLWVPCG